MMMISINVFVFQSINFMKYKKNLVLFEISDYSKLKHANLLGIILRTNDFSSIGISLLWLIHDWIIYHNLFIKQMTAEYLSAFFPSCF